MGEVSTIGLDIAKSVFQIHGVDRDGEVAVQAGQPCEVVGVFAGLPPCVMGIEACPTAHHWSRKLQALGHTVRLMSSELCARPISSAARMTPMMLLDPRGGDTAVDGSRTEKIRTAAVWLDAALQSSASGSSTDDAIQCDPVGHRVILASSRQRDAMARPSCSKIIATENDDCIPAACVVQS